MIKPLKTLAYLLPHRLGVWAKTHSQLQSFLLEFRSLVWGPLAGEMSDSCRRNVYFVGESSVGETSCR